MIFDYTRAALNKVKKDLNVIKWFFNYGCHIGIIVYLIFSLIVENGIFIINLVLLGLSVATLVYTIIYSCKEMTKKEKKQAKKELKVKKHYLKVGSLIVKGISFAITLYGMFVSVTTTSPVSIILTTIMLIIWALSCIIEIATIFVEWEIDYIMVGLKYDVNLTEARDGLAQVISPNVVVNNDPKIEKLKEFVEEERNQQKANVVNALNSVGEKVKNFFKGA